MTPSRNVTDSASDVPNMEASTLSWEEFSGRGDPAQRFRIYCRSNEGELTLIATCGSPEAVGVTIVTLGRERQFDDCALGILDEMGDKGQKWILRPWEKSAANVSAAGKVLRSARKKGSPSA